MFLPIPPLVMPYCVAFTSSIKCCQSLSSPLVLNIPTSPTTSASAFLMSPSEMLTALHAIPDNSSNINLGDRRATLLRRCVHSDLALLKLTEPEKCEAPTFSQFSSNTSYRVIPPAPHDPLTVVPIAVDSKLASFSGALVPFVCFEADDPPKFDGWSGSPIVREDTGAIVAVLIQGSGNILDTVPAVFVLHLYYSRSSYVSLARLPGVSVQPLLNTAAQDAFWRTTSRKQETSEGVEEEAIYKLPPRIASVPSHGTGLRVNDLLLRLNGHDVDIDGSIEWGGLRAPIDAAVVTCSGGDSVTATVARDGIVLDVSVTVTSAATRVRGVVDDRIVISNGLVFTPLKIGILDLLRRGVEYKPEAYLNVVDIFSNWKFHLNDPVSEDAAGNDVVIVFGSSSEMGWDLKSARGISMQRVMKVDGRPVEKLADLVGPAEENMEIELGNGFVFVLSRGKEMTMTQEMMVSSGLTES